MDSSKGNVAPADRDPRNDTMPYGSRDAMVYGFDAASWTFLFEEIFVPVFNGNKESVLYKGSEVYYDIPDGVVIKGSRTASHQTEAVMFHGRDSSDAREFSAAVSASLGIEGVSAATSFSIEKSSQISQQDSITTTLISQYKSIYEFHRNETGQLTRGFVSDLNGLPQTYEPRDAANKDKFTNFFQKWGTHYLVHGFFGGNYIFNSQITQSAVETKTAQTIKSSIKTSFNEGVASGAAESDITDKAASDLKLSSNDMTSTIYWTGGSGGSTESQWEANLDVSPTLLNDAISLANRDVTPKFSPIYNLASGATQKAIADALKDYLPPGRPVTEAAVGQVQPVTDMTTPSTMQATSDGFVAMCVQEADQHATLMTIKARSDLDQSSTPLGSVMAMSVRRDHNDSRFDRASVILPISRGSYYTSTYGEFPDAPGAFSTPASAFIPVRFTLGQFEPKIPGTFTAPSDGFLILTCEAIAPLVGLTAPIQIGSIVVALSVCFDFAFEGLLQPKVASLCVPVAKGSTVLDGASVFAPIGLNYTLGWIPMTDPNWKFGPMSKVDSGSNPPQQDGFVIATLKADQDGARGYLEITTQDESGKTDPLYATCSVHNYAGHRRHIIRSTAILPVAASRKWTAKITPTYGSIDADIYWMPIAPA